MKKIKYIAHYNFQESNIKRNCSLAACNIINYITNLLSDMGVKVEIISASSCQDVKFNGKEFIYINNNSSVLFFPSINFPGKTGKIISFLFFKIYRFFYLLFSIKKDDIIIVYHSLELISTLKILKKIKKFNLILQVAEIYSDVNNDEKKRKQELEFFKFADSYVFQTKELNDLINVDCKPYVINNGVYKFETTSIDKFNDGYIHCVYSGTLDKVKGGAINAVSVASLLPDNYFIHILAFGSNDEIDNIQKFIYEINKNSTNAKVKYEGVLSGSEFLSFLQKCDIGLSTQNPEGIYNNTSFPSKILTYLTNGLDVVTVDIPVVRNSEIGDIVYYSVDATPEKLSKAILSVELTKENSNKQKLEQINNNFADSLFKLVSGYFKE